jgi:hypothetical protein
MPPPQPQFHESPPTSVPIRDLGLTIAGTPLEPILARFEQELKATGVRLRPHCYLSTEWGVPFETMGLAIPFYLARPELTALHAERVGHVEGTNPEDILRYLRHEMGHVVNYAYKLYEREDWVKLFGSITQPYREEYRPEPFSPRFVRHLAGWYAQKHPDEDWAETFAVWMMPGRDWRQDYRKTPEALRKLEYCDRVVKEVADQEPLISPDMPEGEDEEEFAWSLDRYYHQADADGGEPPPGLEGALRSVFEEVGHPETDPKVPRRQAGELIRRLERDLMADVYRWTGHFPERTRVLVRQLAALADRLGLVYPAADEGRALVGLTTLVTALAMNHVHLGSYAR